MIRNTTLAVAALTLAAGATAQTAPQRGPSFSLDDNPSNPYTSPFSPPALSAEDPFGIGLPAAFLGLIGGSPTLNVGFVDGDVLYPEPAIMLPQIDIPAPTGEYLNGLSADHERFTQDEFPRIRLRFSVDRATNGLQGTDLNQQFRLNQQPGDIFVSEDFFFHPANFVGTLGAAPFAGNLPTAVPGGANGNQLEIDESRLFLTAGFGPGNFVGPDEEVPPISEGEWDNVDAFNAFPEPRLDNDGDGVTDVDIYTTVPPASAIFVPVSAADIFAVPAGFPTTPPVPWAPAPQMGLDQLGFPSNQFELFDDVDALIVWDNGQLFVDPSGQPNPDLGAQPERDYALFSLAPGSASLRFIRNNFNLPVDAATVFFTDFTGAFAVYAYGSQLGVADFTFGQDDLVANIDALEVFFEQPNPGCPCSQLLADINMDGILNGADFNAFLAAFNAGRCQADQNLDGVINGADFNAWLNNFNNGTPCP